VQAHVVGLPDQSRGEIVAAVIELRAGAIPDTASILAFCRERLASYKVPGAARHPLGGRIAAYADGQDPQAHATPGAGG